MQPMKAVLCAAGLLFFGGSRAIAQPPDELPPLLPPTMVLHPPQTPADTIYALAFWFNAMNFRECAALVDGADFNNEVLTLLQRELEKHKEKDPMSLMLAEPKVEINGDRATAEVQETFLQFDVQAITREVSTEHLQLRRVENVWKIVPRNMNAAAENEQQSVLQNFATFIAFPQLPPNRAPEKACSMNMKQLCLGMMQLAADMEDKFDIKKFIEREPEANKTAKYAKWPTLKQALMPYTKSELLFHCLLDPDKGEGVVSYSFNENLEGIAGDKIANPAAVVLLYEGKDGKLDFRHDGRATVGFADGHVKLISEAESKNLQWKP